jgi:hypothetical protein
MTPPGYETVFEELKIPEDEENIERDADQNVRFINCKRSNNVSLPMRWGKSQSSPSTSKIRRQSGMKVC